jgi:DNA-binding MarR family transcriptional regulator
MPCLKNAVACQVSLFPIQSRSTEHQTIAPIHRNCPNTAARAAPSNAPHRSCNSTLQVYLRIGYPSSVPQEPLELAVTDFIASISLLVRRARAAAASQNLSWTEAGVLKRLAVHGPSTTADLARAQSMRPQSMRPILTTLEKLAMIDRKPHPTDGRQVQIALTAKGAAAHKSVGDAKRTWIAQAIAQLHKQDRDTRFAAGKIVKRLVEADRGDQP